jgi:PAP2 superfamily
MNIRSIKLAGVVTAALAVPALYSAPAFADGGFNWGNSPSTSASVQGRITQLRAKSHINATNTLERLLGWHEVMLDANALDHTASRYDGDQQGPTRNSRAFAITAIAVYDAVNAFDHKFQPYSTIAAAPAGASRDAAIAQAAYDTLTALYPKQKNRLKAIYNSDMAKMPGTKAAIAAGSAVGAASAAAILASRVGDGSEVGEVGFGLGGNIAGADINVRGDAVNSGNRAAPNWTPDPVGKARGVALGASWGAVKPFNLASGNQFRIPNYPTPGSARFTAAYNDAATNGADPSVPGSTNTAAYRFIGDYWGYDGAPLLGTPPRLYNQITVKIANDQGLTDVNEYARLLAILNATMGDSGIAAWDSKYYHNYWRPVTGVRSGDVDGDPSTVGNATWRPFGASVVNAAAAEAFTPPFPAYPSGHATFGAAMAQTLTSYFGNNTAFTFVSDEYDGKGVDPKGDPRPLVPVRYTTLLEAQKENGRSRVYNGVHWEPDDTEGQVLGTNIVNYTLATAFQRLPE